MITYGNRKCTANEAAKEIVADRGLSFLDNAGFGEDALLAWDTVEEFAAIEAAVERHAERLRAFMNTRIYDRPEVSKDHMNTAPRPIGC